MFDPERLISDLFEIQNVLGSDWQLAKTGYKLVHKTSGQEIATKNGLHFSLDKETQLYSEDILVRFVPCPLIETDSSSINMMRDKPNLTRLDQTKLHALIDQNMQNKNNIKWIYNTTWPYSVEYEQKMENFLKIKR